MFRFLFSIRNQGWHRIVTILGVRLKFKRKLQDILPHINKKAMAKKIEKFVGWGLNQELRENKLIVSLTSFPQRMYDIHFTLYSLLTQTVKPDELILWLAEEEFPEKEKNLSESVLQLQKNGLSIKWCKNLRSYKKLIPALKEFPNDIIVTADDDIFYPQNWLALLYESYLEDKKSIHCHRGYSVKVRPDGLPVSYNEWLKANYSGEASLNVFPTTGAGVLYSPACFCSETLKENAFLRLSPYADDVWFWAMMVLSGTKNKVVKNNIDVLVYVNLERELNLNGEFTLLSLNKTESGNDAQLKQVLEAYPQIKDCLRNENTIS